MRAQVVWFKRDLSVVDHAPLAEAARRGPIVALYVFQPRVHTAPDFTRQRSAQANLAFD